MGELSLGIHIMGTLSLAVSHHVSIGGTCICKHDGDSVGSKDVESETNGHPHPGRAPALTCPLTGHVSNVWYVSGESKVNTPNWDPPPSLVFIELIHLMAAFKEMGMRMPGKKYLI